MTASNTPPTGGWAHGWGQWNGTPPAGLRQAAEIRRIKAEQQDRTGTTVENLTVVAHQHQHVDTPAGGYTPPARHPSTPGHDIRGLTPMVVSQEVLTECARREWRQPFTTELLFAEALAAVAEQRRQAEVDAAWEAREQPRDEHGRFLPRHAKPEAGESQ